VAKDADGVKRGEQDHSGDVWGGWRTATGRGASWASDAHRGGSLRRRGIERRDRLRREQRHRPGGRPDRDRRRGRGISASFTSSLNQRLAGVRLSRPARAALAGARGQTLARGNPARAGAAVADAVQSASVNAFHVGMGISASIGGARRAARSGRRPQPPTGRAVRGLRRRPARGPATRCGTEAEAQARAGAGCDGHTHRRHAHLTQRGRPRTNVSDEAPLARRPAHTPHGADSPLAAH
jgi:hypothetical protein